MYRIKRLKECQVIIKYNSGRRAYVLERLDNEDLLLSNDDFKSISKSVNALINIGVLRIVAAQNDKVVKDEDELSQEMSNKIFDEIRSDVVKKVKSDNKQDKNYGADKGIAILLKRKAESLLSGEGLNHSSFTRAYGLDSNVSLNKRTTKKEYDIVLKMYKDKIIKQGHDYFWKKEK